MFFFCKMTVCKSGYNSTPPTKRIFHFSMVMVEEGVEGGGRTSVKHADILYLSIRGVITRFNNGRPYNSTDFTKIPLLNSTQCLPFDYMYS